MSIITLVPIAGLLLPNAWASLHSPRVTARPERVAITTIRMGGHAKYDASALQAFEECVISADGFALSECQQYIDPIPPANPIQKAFVWARSSMHALASTDLEMDVRECLINAESAEERSACVS